MRAVILLLAATGTILAQVPQAPPPVPTPRATPFPPAGPGAVNNPPVINTPSALGRTFEQPVVGAGINQGIGQRQPASGVLHQPGVGVGTSPQGNQFLVPSGSTTNIAGVTIPGPLISVETFRRNGGAFPVGTNGVAAVFGPSFVGTNFPPGEPSTFGFVGTNFPPQGALDTNAAFGTTLVTNVAGAITAQPADIAPAPTPPQLDTGSAPGFQQGTGEEIIINFPPGTRIVPNSRGIPPEPAREMTPDQPPIQRPTTRTLPPR